MLLSLNKTLSAANRSLQTQLETKTNTKTKKHNNSSNNPNNAKNPKNSVKNKNNNNYTDSSSSKSKSKSNLSSSSSSSQQNKNNPQHNLKSHKRKSSISPSSASSLSPSKKAKTKETLQGLESEEGEGGSYTRGGVRMKVGIKVSVEWRMSDGSKIWYDGTVVSFDLNSFRVLYDIDHTSYKHSRHDGSRWKVLSIPLSDSDHDPTDRTDRTDQSDQTTDSSRDQDDSNPFKPIGTAPNGGINVSTGGSSDPQSQRQVTTTRFVQPGIARRTRRYVNHQQTLAIIQERSDNDRELNPLVPRNQCENPFVHPFTRICYDAETQSQEQQS